MGHLAHVVDSVEREFWEAAGQGVLLVRYCVSCEKPHWQPRPICPHCGHAQTTFRRSAGTGDIYSLTWVHTKDKPPQSLAYVRLDEGIVLLTRLTGDGVDRAAIGQRVELVFEGHRDGQQLPVFRLSFTSGTDAG